METLETLFSSRVRVALLKTLFAHPQERFYGRELARLSGERQSAVWRELQNLEQAGLVKRCGEANMTYFGVQSEHPLFHELHSLIKKALELEGVSVPAARPDGGVTSKRGLCADRPAAMEQLVIGEND